MRVPGYRSDPKMIRLPTRELAMAMTGTAPGAGADRWFGALEVLLSMAAAAAGKGREEGPPA